MLVVMGAAQVAMVAGGAGAQVAVASPAAGAVLEELVAVEVTVVERQEEGEA